MGMTELGTERSTAVPHGSAGQQRRRVIKASAAGTVIEWYDFTLYGLAAALVFGPLYFPGAGSRRHDGRLRDVRRRPRRPPDRWAGLRALR